MTGKMNTCLDSELKRDTRVIIIMGIMMKLPDGQRTIVVPAKDLPSSPVPQPHRALAQAVPVSHLYRFISSSRPLEFQCVIQVVFTIVCVANVRSLSVDTVIVAISIALVSALNNLVMKNSKKPLNAINPAIKDDNDMLSDSVNIVNDSNNLTKGKKKK